MKKVTKYKIGACVLLLATISIAATNVELLLSAVTAYKHDNATGGTSFERVPGAQVQLPSGKLTFDTVDVVLKGDRGLDFPISRSYGKVMTGQRAMANWELEVPRLSLVTGPSTKLKGDSETGGICANTGDLSTSKDASGNAVYAATVPADLYSEIQKATTDYNVNQANLTYTQTYANLLSIYKGADPSSSNQQTYQMAVNNINYAMTLANAMKQSELNKALAALTTTQIYNDSKTNFKNATESLGNSLSENVYLVVYISGPSGGYTTIKTRADLQSFINNQKIRALGKDANGKINVQGVASSFLSPLIANLLQIMILSDAVFEANNQQPNVIVYTSSPPSLYLNASTSPLFSVVSSSGGTPYGYSIVTQVDERKRPVTLYLPGQSNRVFYPISTVPTGFPATAKYISQDNWILTCGVGGEKGFIAHSPAGVRYSFPETNRENQPGFPTLYQKQSFPGRVTIFASSVENVFKESYEMIYQKISGVSTIAGYNNPQRLLLTQVAHKLNGVNNDNVNGYQLKFNYKNYNQGWSQTYAVDATGAGENVLVSIDRKRGSSTVTNWVSYDYAVGTQQSTYSLSGTDEQKTFSSLQDEQSAKIYLSAITYLNGDKYQYTYTGPYDVSGSSHKASSNSNFWQGYVWFYSAPTSVTYSRKTASGGYVDGYQANWKYKTYTQDGNTEYVVDSSSYVDKVNSTTPNYSVSYIYKTRTAENKRSVDIGLPGKTLTYTFYDYAKGNAENALHGYPYSIVNGDKTVAYTWEDSGVVIGQQPDTTKTSDYTAMSDVKRYRQQEVTTSHKGTYKNTVNAFDAYDNPKQITSSGYEGQTPVSRTVDMMYDNKTTLDNDAWWILGLKTSESVGTSTLWSATYDNQGAQTSRTEKGVTTEYKYTTVSMLNCATWDFSAFIGCIADKWNGVHVGLVVKQDVGSGASITYFNDYYKGVPRNIQLPNGETEKREVDDYGNITKSTDADGIVSNYVYDNSGLLISATPIQGLATTTISRDGFTVRLTTGDGVVRNETQTQDGYGRVRFNAVSDPNVSSGGGRVRLIQSARSYDALGRLSFESYPGNTASGTSYQYDQYDRITSQTEGKVTYLWTYQNCAACAQSTVSDGAQTITRKYYALGDFSTALMTEQTQSGGSDAAITTTTAIDPTWLSPSSSKRGNTEQTYAYKTNGQLDSITDSVTGKTSFAYDGVGRLETATFADNSTEKRVYDDLGNIKSKTRTLGDTTDVLSFEYSNAGRITKATSAHAIMDYGYDTYKRLTSITQTITANKVSDSANRKYAISYDYNALSHVTSMTYPSGKTIDYSQQNALGELSSIPGIVDSFAYDAYGISSLTRGNGISLQQNRDTAGRLSEIIYKPYNNVSNGLTYAYCASFGYDSQNRINGIVDNCGQDDAIGSITRYATGQVKAISGAIAAGANGNAATFTYTYNADDVKSLTKTVGTQTTTWIYNYQSANSPMLDAISNSPYSKFEYARGRVTKDGTRTMTYDLFGRMLTETSVSQPANNSQFYYAADGLRVSAKRSNGGKTEISDYMYDLSGNLLYEENFVINAASTGLDSRLKTSYVYAGGQLIATLESYPDIDTDKDGLMDEYELENGMNPNDASDAYKDPARQSIDGMLLRYKIANGLNPNTSDSDGDGFSDRYEIEFFNGDINAAKNATQKPSMTEEQYRLKKCNDTKCWLVPITSLILG